MPPPMISLSTLAARLLEHGRSWSTPWRRRRRPTTGRCGFSSAVRSASISSMHAAARHRPGSMRAMPSVEACARWAAEKASLTKMSPSLASALAKCRVVLLLALVEAHVLQHRDLAVRRAPRRPRPPSRRCSRATKCTGCPAARPARRPPGAATSRIGTALGAPEVRDDDDAAPRAAESLRPGAMRSRRVASVTLPSATGTLRSARTSTRLPLTSSGARSA